MSYTARFSEYSNPLIVEYADQFPNGTFDSAWVSMMNYHRGLLLLNVGDLQAGVTVDVSIRQATSTTGTGAKAITGKAITQLTQVSGDSDMLLVIELQTEELDVDNGFDCVGVRMVIANGGAELGYTYFGLIPRFPPVPTTNYDEIVG